MKEKILTETNITLDNLFKNSKVRRKSTGELIPCFRGSYTDSDYKLLKNKIIWLSPKDRFAKDYGNVIKKFYVNIERPFFIGDHSISIVDEFDSINVVNKYNLALSTEFVTLASNLHFEFDYLLDLLMEYYNSHKEDYDDFESMNCWCLWYLDPVLERIKNIGYDGFIGNEIGTPVVAVFSPKQLIATSEVQLTEGMLNEDSRSLLLSKSRKAGPYKDQSRGKNRFERKKFSKIAKTVKQYNQINMNDLFKKDLLQVTIPVTGETDNYNVTIKMDGVVAEIQKNIKNNNNKFEFKTVVQALTKIFNTKNIYVNCTCPDYTYNYAHWNIVNNVSTDDSAHDPGPGKGIKNPTDSKGRGCKHILLVLANGDWMMKVASVINNYVHYAEEHLQKPFLKVIFPAIYGIPADEAAENNLIPEEDEEQFLDSSKGFIDAINEYGRNRGKFRKGQNKNPVRYKEANKDKINETENNSDKA